MRLALAALLAACAATSGCATSRTAHAEQTSRSLPDVPAGIVDGTTGAALARAGALLVDVRSPEEYAAGHVPGAVNVPHDQLPARIAELGPPGTPVVLYCRSGRRSGLAAETLRAAGFERVWDARRLDEWPRDTGVAGR